MPDPTHLFAVLAAALAGLLGTLAMRALARRIGFVNHPNPIVPQHTAAVAYGGGVGVWLGFVAACLATGSWSALAVGTAAALLGLLDDARPLSPPVKLAAQVAPALLFAVLLAPPLTGSWPVDLAISTFVALTAMNAVNFTDVCDGLVGSLGVIALGGLGVLTGEVALVGLAAGCLGFLALNRPPATIYLGDAGSHLVGLGVAWGALSLIAQPGPLASQLVAAVLLPGVFLFELVFITAVRVHKGLPFWRGSPDHFSLRMQAGPFSKVGTVLTACAAAVALLALALLALLGGPGGAVLAVLLAATLATVAWLLLLRWEVPPRSAPSEPSGPVASA